jgi:septum formation protein
MPPFIYLASQSPRRSQLLSQLGIAHELLLADAEEDAESLEAHIAGESPRDYVQRVTRLKWDAALKRLQLRGLPPAPVLCADTTVALGDTIHAKPADAEDAVRMLRDLSGQTHEVLTAVAIGTATHCEQACSASQVTFAAMTEAEIRTYVDSGESMGKAGSYAVQGLAAAYISRISGSYTGIMGLPLYETAQLLQKLS